MTERTEADVHVIPVSPLPGLGRHKGSRLPTPRFLLYKPHRSAQSLADSLLHHGHIAALC
jgi:hypothetical protein